MAYQGQDLIDYEAGEEYLPQRYYQQKFQRNITGPEIMGQDSGITGASVAKPYVIEPQGGQGGGGTGFGTWGDLDESSKKTFDKQVWGDTKPGGIKGWTTQPVTGYRNVKSGLYQTKEGKNINHLGLEIPSFLGSIVNIATGTKFGEKKVGDIKGTFSKDNVSEEDQAIYDAAIHRSRMNKIKAGAFINPTTGKSIYDGTNIHGGGEDLSKGDGPTPSAINIEKKAIGMPEHLTRGGGQPHGTDTSGDFAGKGTGNPFNRADGGRIGYNRGRVVNPGGYAGEDEGGILEWIKSKIGTESETNPTIFGTQNSLLNQGSIAQLQDAIKSYEALMMMGDLDEEQLADYELKMNQLQALTEGAEQKAHGGRIGYKDPGGLVGRGAGRPTAESQTIEVGSGIDAIRYELVNGELVPVLEGAEPQIIEMGDGIDEIRYELVDGELVPVIQKASGGRVPFFYGGLATIL